VKFLIDMPLSPGLAKWLNSEGHEAVHANEANLNTAPDILIVEYAASENQIIVTADLDYPRLLAQIKAHKPGLILFRGGNYSDREAIERLTRLFETLTPGEIEGSVVVIEKRRIRKRRLPID
jgi:predicted nuclease of predicted toxin-antitoxin system